MFSLSSRWCHIVFFAHLPGGPNRLPVHYWEDRQPKNDERCIDFDRGAGEINERPPFELPRIDVDTERDMVNLSGVVATEAQRAQASRLVKQERVWSGSITICRSKIALLLASYPHSSPLVPSVDAGDH
jgi:hypothetical protein